MPAPLIAAAAPRSIENDDVRVTVLEEGGHIAEILDKRSGNQPAVDAAVAIDRAVDLCVRRASRIRRPAAEAALLAGIMGHNLCLDIFGGPSAEEAAAGLTAHGEASIVRYDIDVDRDSHSIAMQARLPLAQLQSRRAGSSSRPRAARSAKPSRISPRAIGRSAGPSTSRSARRFSRRASPSSACRRRVRRSSSRRSARTTIWPPAATSTGRRRRGRTAAPATCAVTPMRRTRALTPRT